jgi:hypothetical protein
LAEKACGNRKLHVEKPVEKLFHYIFETDDFFAETFSMGHQIKYGRFSFVCGGIGLPETWSGSFFLSEGTPICKTIFGLGVKSIFGRCAEGMPLGDHNYHGVSAMLCRGPPMAVERQSVPSDFTA